MSTIPTQNPVPSEAAKDLKFNSGKIDEFVTSNNHFYTDRFGKKHYTIDGINYLSKQAMLNYGYITKRSFESGNTIINPNDVLLWESNGEYYRWDGELPKAVSAGSTPESAGGIGEGEWVGVGSAALKGELIKKRNQFPSVAFVFDDGLSSAYDVVAPLFKENKLRCGFAVYAAGINSSGNMTGSQVIELSQSGFEIICHATTPDPLDSSMSIATGEAEILTCMSMFNSMGINASIFQAPSSVIDDKHMPIISSIFRYAFTKAPSESPLKDESAMHLHRFGIDNASMSEIESVINNAIKDNSSVIFYAHDLVKDSPKYRNVVNAINYCNDNKVNIMSPSEVCGIACQSPNNPSSEVVLHGVIDNGVTDWVADIADISVSDGIRRDITATFKSSGVLSISKKIKINGVDVNTVTLSSVFRAMTNNQSIGYVDIIFYDAYDNVVLESSKEIKYLTNFDQRQFVTSQAPQSATSVKLQFRATGNEGDKILLRMPILNDGTSVTPNLSVNKFIVNEVIKVKIPVQDIVANASYNRIKLSDLADNGVFSIKDNVIYPSKGETLSISISIFSNASNVQNIKGGILRLNAGANLYDSYISSAAVIAGVSLSAVLDTDSKRSINLSMLSNGDTFKTHPDSYINIQRINR